MFSWLFLKNNIKEVRLMRKSKKVLWLLIASVAAIAFPAQQVLAASQMQSSAMDRIATFLTQPLVIAALLILAGLSFGIELFTKGFSAFGIIGLIFVFIYFFSHIMLGSASWVLVLIFVIGFVLVLLEVVVPGGIVGTLGVLGVLISIFLAGFEDWFTIMIALACALLVMWATILIMIKVLGKRMNIFRKLVLRESTKTEEGYVSSENRPELVGKSGKTKTALRPAGTMVLDGNLIDVVSEGDFIESDVTVTVVKVEGMRVVVRKGE